MIWDFILIGAVLWIVMRWVLLGALVWLALRCLLTVR